MVLEAPLITESALEVIRKYCEDEVGTRRVGNVRVGDTGTSPDVPHCCYSPPTLAEPDLPRHVHAA